MNTTNQIKRRVTVFEIATKLPGLVKDLPKIVAALYYNFSITPSSEVSFGNFLRNAARRYPDNICILYQDKKWTYRVLNAWVNRLSQHFIKSGIQKGDVVALMMENRPEIIAISMALAKIGAITALINTSQRNQTLLYSFQLSNAKLILIGEELISHFKEIAKDDIFVSVPVFAVKHSVHKKEITGYSYFDIEARRQSDNEPKLKEKIYARDACLYIYTSGTTGLPKASVISHGRWIKGYSAFGLVNLRLASSDILYVTLPFYHATAMVVCWSSVIASGASMAINNKFSVSGFWKDIKHYQATAFAYVGEMCKYLLNAPVSPFEKNNTLKKMMGNGLRPDIWKEFKTRFGIEQIAEFYGSSEGNIAFFNVFNLDATMGFSITEYAIVEYDMENEEPRRDKKGRLIKVKSGGVGLLLGEISDRYPYDGYTEKNKTEKTILRNAFKQGDAWFNTNDLVRDLGLGHTQFVDRLGDTFRWKGENVSTLEVEGIINQFDGIEESIVYGVAIDGYNGKAGMANLIVNESSISTFNFDKLYNFMAKQLPSYALPVFLRLSNYADTTDTFKHKKHLLKQEGFTPKDSKTLIYILKDKKYQKLNKRLLSELSNGEIKL